MVLTFGLLSSGLFPSSDVSGQGMGANQDTVIWNDVGIGIIPISGVCCWAKTLTGTPALLPSFVECNGQVLDDGDSPLNGQTMPDMNNTQRFARGSTTSGTTGGTETHLHSSAGRSDSHGTGGQGFWEKSAQNSSNTTTLPPYYEYVWIIRIK